MSIRKGSRTIASSVPVTEWGSIDGTLADQADIKSALDSKAPTYSPTFTGTPIAPTAPIDTSNNQIATTKYVQDALLNAEANLPEQSGNAGKFLTTDGSIPSWESITGLPSQTSQSGKFLTTNGTSASWANAVTTDTAQTITGNKIIENSSITSSTVDGVSLTIKSDNQHLGTNPSSNHISSINFTDDSNATVAKFSSIQTSDGWSGFLAGAGSDPTNPHNNMLMIANGNNKLLLVPPTTSHASCAVRRDFFDTEFGKTVKNTGDETIAGTKTFTSNLIVKSSVAEKEVVPSTNSFYGLELNDKNNAEIGVVYLRDTSTEREIVMKVHAFDGTSQNYIKVGFDTNNNPYTYAPTPSSVTDNTTKIATTAWVINVLKALYPVGSLYMGTQNSCPLSAFFGTWTLVSAGNALWTGNGTSGSGTTANANYSNAAANTTIAAGVPNIKDNFYFVDTYYGSVALAPNSDNGLIKYNSKTTSGETNRSDTDGTTTSRQKYVFDASQVNAIYGKSSTVQPPAYVVNVWRRTA